MKYVIEPMQFALNENFTEVEFLMFLKRLYEWRDWLNRCPEDVYILSDTQDILAYNNLYPVGDILKKLAKTYKVATAQASDLDQFLSNLIRQTQKIDKLCQEEEYELSSVEIQKDKENPLPERAKDIDDGLQKLLWFTDCHKRKTHAHDGSYVVFANDIKGKFNVTLLGNKLEDNKGNLKILERTDNMSVRFMPYLKTFLLDKETPVVICQEMETKADLDFAIRIATYQIKTPKKFEELYKLYNFYVQDSFFKDFCRNKFYDDDSLLRSIFEAMPHTLLYMNMGQRHDLRTGKGGANKQRKSKDKKYLAWRRYVTTSVKMHYWQKDEEFWFANIEEHDFDWITEEFNKPKSLTLRVR